LCEHVRSIDLVYALNVLSKISSKNNRQIRTEDISMAFSMSGNKEPSISNSSLNHKYAEYLIEKIKSSIQQ